MFEGPSNREPRGRPKATGYPGICLRPIDELKPDPRNPRVHSRKQVKQIANSILAFGFNVPVLIDRDSTLIAGHGRLLAARHLGWQEVPTLCLDHLNPSQVQAFRIADNRLTEIATWDERLLAETLRDPSVLDINLDLEATGFEMGEIDLLIEGLRTEDNTQWDADSQSTEPVGPAVSRLGDLWELGRHSILCGSALEADAYTALISKTSASMMFTDPPYNVPITGHVSGLGAIRHREFAMAVGEMKPAEFVTFLEKALELAVRHCQNGSLYFVCMDWRHIAELLTAGRSVYTELKNICIWVKDNAGMGSFYRSQHEFVAVFKHGRGQHRNNIELGKFGRTRSNVWHYPGGSSFGRISDEGNLLALHPTVKPVQLVADAILDASARGDVVLDPFLGSGTTLIACERVGRRCRGLELDPLYVDTIVRRWQALTGDTARHASGGETFDAVAKERGGTPEGTTDAGAAAIPQETGHVS
jgi:DNA modification methylase